MELIRKIKNKIAKQEIEMLREYRNVLSWPDGSGFSSKQEFYHHIQLALKGFQLGEIEEINIRSTQFRITYWPDMKLLLDQEKEEKRIERKEKKDKKKKK